MDLTVIRYVVIVVALLILIWAVVEMMRRFPRKSKQARARELGSWVEFDITASKKALHDEPLTAADEASNALDAQASQDMQQRAQHNGHYSGSKKGL